jgi:hypothetical protein
MLDVTRRPQQEGISSVLRRTDSAMPTCRAGRVHATALNGIASCADATLEMSRTASLGTVGLRSGAIRGRETDALGGDQIAYIALNKNKTVAWPLDGH